jgi:hypothetical protein
MRLGSARVSRVTPVRLGPMTSRHRRVFLRLFRRDAETKTRDACATRKTAIAHSWFSGEHKLAALAPWNRVNAKLLRALFERAGFAAQKRERFAGKMERAGDQDTLARLLRSRDRFGNRWSDGVGE